MGSVGRRLKANSERTKIYLNTHMYVHGVQKQQVKGVGGFPGVQMGLDTRAIEIVFGGAPARREAWADSPEMER
jgi:hypothetical protein